MRGPQTIIEQRMAKDIQDIEIKVNSIIETKRKQEKAFAIIMTAGTAFLFTLMCILFA